MFFAEAGTNIGRFANSSSDFIIKSVVNDKDMIFQGTDGGSAITALTLDMSAQGTAIFNSNINIAGDDTKLKFGADSEIELTHYHNVGLMLKNTNTGNDAGIPHFILQSGETDIASGDYLGTIQFQAPDEATGTDAILIAGAIDARAEGDCSSSNNATSLHFRTGSSGVATGKMTISSAGKVGIGGTQTSMFSIHYNGWTQADGIRLYDTYGSAQTNNALQIIRNGNQVGSITHTLSATAFNTSSDYRLKENVDYTWDATTRLKQLKPARFNFIADDTNTLVDGFLAHEAATVVPEAVTGTHNETEVINNVVLKADGSVNRDFVTEAEWTQGKLDSIYSADTTWVASKTVPKYQGIDQAKLVPLLVKTIQELESRITALEG